MTTSAPIPQFDIKDALRFMDEVKKEFGASSQEYETFIEILKGFRERTIGFDEVITRVSTLFNGRPALIQGFNLFVPLGQAVEPHPHPNGGTTSTTSVKTAAGEALHGLTRL
ncbi:hypothetical protein C8Q79DRAFT_963508 [Trametes meyenii]|nr:hypothetical protein C8Q79DRAFT_963508 [Trametes meyenii]